MKAATSATPKGDQALLSSYLRNVSTHSRIDREEEKELARRIEQGDEEARQLWERFTGLSLREFRRIYRRLGVEFEYYTGELK